MPFLWLGHPTRLSLSSQLLGWVWKLLLVHFPLLLVKYTCNFKALHQWATTFLHLVCSLRWQGFLSILVAPYTFKRPHISAPQRAIFSTFFSLPSVFYCCHFILGVRLMSGARIFLCSSLSFRQILCARTAFASPSN